MKTFDRQFSKILTPLLIFIVFILLLPAILTQNYCFNLDFSRTGQVGDTIGGIMGPFIAIAAAILTFFAFWVQYKANEQQKKDLKIERFENRFFEMIRLHKENVNEISIDGYEFVEEKETRISPKVNPTQIYTLHSGRNLSSTSTAQKQISTTVQGRTVIDSINIEIRASLEICKDLFSEREIAFENDEKLTVDQKKRYLFKMAYTLVFMGVHTDTVQFINPKIKNDGEHLKNCRDRLREVQKLYSYKQRIITLINSEDKVNLTIKFAPFEGHSAQLGHYFRHLFQTVKYVVKQKDEIIDDLEKIDNLRMLRAQLSNQEQLLLYFNYLAGFGKNWENEQNKFLTDYRMIHNIPIKEAEFCISPLCEFREARERLEKAGKKLFELDGVVI